MALQTIYADIGEIFTDKYSTNLKTNYATGVSAVTVYSINQFAINKIVVIGEYANKGSEIIKTHASTAPTGSTITFASATVLDHAKNSPVSLLSFDQIEFSHSDTLNGTKTVLGSLMNIDPQESEMHYDDTTNTSGYYFTRYKNSITGLFSDYSDGIPYSGMPANTVGYAIDTAMTELNVAFSEKLTFAMLIGFANQMLRLVRGKLIAWNKYKKEDQVLGTVSQGVRSYSLPADVYDQTSDRSILNLRIGNGLPLTPLSKNEYLQATEDVSYTTVSTQAEIATTSLVLTDTSDLDDNGVVDVYVSGTKYTIEYTANNKSTNTLAIANDQVTAILPVGSQVWQNINEDTPEFFAVWDGNLYLWPIIDSSLEGQNITADYLTDIETIDSQMDVLLGRKFDMLIPYLKYKIRGITEHNAEENLNDPNYAEFRELLNDTIRLEPLERASFRPRSRAIYGRSMNNRR